MLVGRLLGEALLRLRQPAVMGQLMAGLVLGPSILGALFPDVQHALFPAAKEQKAMLDAVSQFGVLLILLMTGMETDLKLVKASSRASISASVFGIIIPFACGFALGEFLPDAMIPDPSKRLITSLFLGTALSIASVKIVATVVREMNFLRRTVGQVILGSAIVDDTIGWIIIAVIFGLALQGHVDPLSIAKSVIGTLAFMAFSLTIGRRLVSLAIRWVNDTFVSEFAVITAILVIMGLMALTTHMIGVHAVLGAFVAGILVGESPILTRHIDEQLRGLILAFFMPVFFGTAGLERRSHGAQGPSPSVADARPDRHRHDRKIRRRLPRRRARRAVAARGAGAGDRHERARLDRGDRRHHRPVDGRAEPGPVHDDRDDGDPDHAGDAADLALGARPAADAQGGKGTARTRGDGGQGLRVETRAPAGGGGRQRQRPVRLPRRRHDRRHPLDADDRDAHHRQQKNRPEEIRGQEIGRRQRRRRKRPKKMPRSAPRPRPSC